MPSLEWNLNTWSDPNNLEENGDLWSNEWGGPVKQWYGCILPRIARHLPTKTILEIGPGGGRWTQFLLELCQNYCGVDISPLCVNLCRERFNIYLDKATFIQNNGILLNNIPDDSIDFVFSFDSLVHTEIDVVASYIIQIIKKLDKDGVAFLHHSNALNGVDNGDPTHTQSGRSRSVSSSVIKVVIEAAGGRTLTQEEITWQDSVKRIDCFTTFCKKDAHPLLNYTFIENNNFMKEAEMIRTSMTVREV